MSDHILEALEKLEPSYVPNEHIQQQLGEKILLLFVAPVGAGKSTVMNELVKADSAISRISGFTTRDPRPNDEPRLYRYIPSTPEGLGYIHERAVRREMVQYAVHPKTKQIYGTDIEDYPNTFNCKDVLTHGVETFRNLGAERTITISLVCEPMQWIRQINERYPDQSAADLQSRLGEASINLAWSLQDSETHFVENNDGELDATVRAIQLIMQGERRDDSRERTLAHAMLGIVS